VSSAVETQPDRPGWHRYYHDRAQRRQDRAAAAAREASEGLNAVEAVHAQERVRQQVEREFDQSEPELSFEEWQGEQRGIETATRPARRRGPWPSHWGPPPGTEAERVPWAIEQITRDAERRKRAVTPGEARAGLALRKTPPEAVSPRHAQLLIRGKREAP